MHLIRRNERQMLVSWLQRENQKGNCIIIEKFSCNTWWGRGAAHFADPPFHEKWVFCDPLRLDIRRYRIALLNKLFKAWKDHKIRVNYLTSVVYHCLAIVEHVAHIDSN